MDITLTEEPTLLAALVRRTVPMDALTEFYDTAYSQVVAALTAAGGAPAGAAFGWYHGMPTDTVDVAAGFPVHGLPPGSLTDEVEVVEIPGGRSLVADYEGPYDGLAGAWQSVEEHRAAAGLAARGDFLEVYVTEPSPGGDPARNRTRLVLPLS